MDGPETGLVRWSPNAGVDSFLHVNLQHRIVQLYEPTGYAKTGQFEYRNVSKHEDFPTLTSFDWSPTMPGVVAVGTPTGVVNLLKIDDNSNAYCELKLKMSRTCQAVTFSTANRLVVGLDRVRSDRSLHIWDVNRLAESAVESVASSSSSSRDQKTGFPANMAPFNEPLEVREPSVSVSSARFFEDNPNTLVVGIKSQGLRIHDLRDSSSQMPSFQTRCNNNLAIDYADQNYFVSSALDHPGIVVWDRRASSRALASPHYLDAVDVDGLPWGGALQLQHAVSSESEQAMSESKGSVIRSLRYCRDHRGMLGVLSGTGQLKVYEAVHEYCPPEMAAERSPELLEVRRSNEMDNQYADPRHKGERIVSFDFVTIGSPALRPRVLVLRANGSFDIVEKPSFTTTYPFKLIPWTAPYRGLQEGSSYHAMMQLEMTQAAEILGPVALEEALADIPIFAADADKIESATQKAQKTRADQLAEGEGGARKAAQLPAEFFAADTVAAQLKILRAYAKQHLRQGKKAATPAAPAPGHADLTDSTASLASLASLSGRPLTSQELHESLLTSTLVRQGFPSEAQAVLDHVMLLRAKERYLFDCETNRAVVADDPWLVDVWGWIADAEAVAEDGGMMAHSLDLSFMGVANIWLEDLGGKKEARLVSMEPLPLSFPASSHWQRTIGAICQRHGLGVFDGVETRRPLHRQLCLAICEWGRPRGGRATKDESQDYKEDDSQGDDDNDDDDDDNVNDNDNDGHARGRGSTSSHTMAAAQALFRGDSQQAVQILKRASSAHPELLFVSLALQMMGGLERAGRAREQQQRELPRLDFDEALASRTDPYLRAISSLIATGGDWTTIAHQTSLPLRERVAVAVRTFGDRELTVWLREARAEAVRTGDVEGVVLTGLTDGGVDIWARYVERFHDVQTAALVTGFVAPRYTDDVRCAAWRRAYRAYLQRHRAFFARAKFEVEGTKRSKAGRGAPDEGRPRLVPPPRQIALRCVYCDTQTRLGSEAGGAKGNKKMAKMASSSGLAGDPLKAGVGGASLSGAGSGSAVVSEKENKLRAKLVAAGVSCPNCKRHLPRCVVCLEIVGTPRSDRPEVSTDADIRLAAQFPTFCLQCDHVLHLDHARQWFSRHAECPVPECRCRCNFRANPELNYA